MSEAPASAPPRGRPRGARGPERPAPHAHQAILSEADEVGARAIVLGTRGLAGIRSLLLGSVSPAVLQHADRPVIVVPSPEEARDRADHWR